MSQPAQSPSKPSIHALTLAALGIVFGDIGTSPLYAVREAFHGPHAIAMGEANILGILSLIVWALIIIISIKYLLFVMRAGNKGEGGVMALMSLAVPKTAQKSSGRALMILYMGLFGSALLFGDGVITPAISVLSAVEGLSVATPFFDPYVMPITLVILFTLFYGQRFGTAKIGSVFGPVIFAWFAVIGVLGFRATLDNPHVFQAVSPVYGLKFLLDNGWHGILALGAVFLAVTGGEALYADMGHFGRSPIQRGWFFVALPALLLNYFGQGAILLSNPEAASHPFYRLAPEWALYPLVVLATSATVIASQALISGVFSLTSQAVQLGYLPRFRIIHTSSQEIGQIYIPQINWVLFTLTAWLVFEFGSSSKLASAYGIAVSTTMVITTILTCIVAYNLWRWNALSVGATMAFFLTVDGIFLVANATKVHDGGWFPLTMGLAVFTLMTTWRTGRRILKTRLRAQSVPLEVFFDKIRHDQPARVAGTAIFMTGDQRVTPPALAHNVRHNKVLHTTNVFMTVISKEVPTIDFSERVELVRFDNGFYRVVAKYGFMETPDIKEILVACAARGLALNLPDITFFLGRETLIASQRPGMAVWREHLFSFMTKNAERATAYFNIPVEQVVEVGIQVEI